MAITTDQKDYKFSNETQTLVPQCKVVVYPWAYNTLTVEGGSEANLAASTPIDVSSQLLNVSFTKTLGAPSGSFSFTLSNSPNYKTGDWKDIIKRGEWCVIYMTQEGDLSMTSQVGTPDSKANKIEEAKKIRCIGYIDRVSVRSEMTETGAFDVTYQVSGRDFGVVYEDTTIWADVFESEKSTLEIIASVFLNVPGTVPIDKVLTQMHDLFYNPKALLGASGNIKKGGALTKVSLQWLMPRKLLVDINLKPDSAPFWGELPNIRKFQTSRATLGLSNPPDFLTGNAWENLRKLAITQLHELYTETNDRGLPELVFRHIPFGINNKKYPLLKKSIPLFKDLPFITIKAIDVLEFDLGEDNHDRFNSFLTTLSSSVVGTNSSIEVLRGTGFPKHVQDSIKRHGFRQMRVDINGLVRDAQQDNENLQLLVEFNEVIYDYWNNSVFFETGSATIMGSNLVKVGKALKFDKNTPYVFGKRYYIEGYSDNFTVDEKGSGSWTQTVMLTHGAEESDLKNNASFGDRDTTFNHEGEFTQSGAAKSNKGDS